MNTHILLIEDERRDSRAWVRSAERRGYRLLRCVNGAAALEILDSDRQFSLVLVDAELEDKTGTDGVGIARRILERHDLPVVFLADRGDREIVEHCAHIPAYGFVLRDAGEYVLFHTISTAIDRFEERREIERRLESAPPSDTEQNASESGRTEKETAEIESAGTESAEIKSAETESADEASREHIRFLSETAFELIDADVQQDMYSYLAETLRRLNPHAYVVLNSIDQATTTLQTEAVLGIEPYLERIIRLLGFHPEGKSYRYDASIDDLQNGTVTEFSGGLNELSFGKIPQAAARRVEHLLGIEKIYGIAFLVDREIYANAVMIFPKGRELRDREIVETFAGQAAIALKRRDTERALRSSRRRLEIFLDAHPDFCFLKDGELEYRLCNISHARFLGLGVEEVIGKKDRDLIFPRYAEEMEKTDREAIDTGRLVFTEEKIEGRYYETRKVPVTDEQGRTGVAGIVKEVTEQKRLLERLRQSNEEKDLLMKELNHRVKNNLHMISSLISLKSTELGTEVDLSDVRNQVDAIRILHEKLYETEHITRIDMRSYFEDLLRTVLSTKMARYVEVNTEIEAIQLPTRTAIPLGLIVNEIATNALKYGFSVNRTGTFSVSLNSVNLDEGEGRDEAEAEGENGRKTHCRLVLSNTGPPFPEEVDLSSPKTLGMRLISSLTLQIDGSIELERRPHPTFTITFPIDD